MNRSGMEHAISFKGLFTRASSKLLLFLSVDPGCLTSMSFEGTIPPQSMLKLNHGRHLVFSPMLEASLGVKGHPVFHSLGSDKRFLSILLGRTLKNKLRKSRLAKANKRGGKYINGKRKKGGHLKRTVALTRKAIREANNASEAPHSPVGFIENNDTPTSHIEMAVPLSPPLLDMIGTTPKHQKYTDGDVDSNLKVMDSNRTSNSCQCKSFLISLFHT